MDCNNLEDKLSAYLDNELSFQERAEIEMHVKGCEKCSLALKELQNTVAHVKGIEEVEPPAWLEQKIMAKIREESVQPVGFVEKFFSFINIKASLPALATVAIAVTAFMLFRTIEPEVQKTALEPKTGAPVEREIHDTVVPVEPALEQKSISAPEGSLHARKKFSYEPSEEQRDIYPIENKFAFSLRGNK